MQTKEMNVLVLAYLGDTIYENYVRKILIKRGISNVNDLQKDIKEDLSKEEPQVLYYRGKYEGIGPKE